MTDPWVSDYFRGLAKMRRHPYKGFQHDPATASRAGKIGAESRWHGDAKTSQGKKDKPQEDEPAKEREPKDDPPQTPQWQ